MNSNDEACVINSLTHKWTIDNFGYFFNDKWPIVTIESDKFYSNSNKKHQFRLLLYPNGERDEFRNNLSIFLIHSSSNNVDVKVRWKISIINENGNKFNTQVRRNIFYGKEDIWGIGDYICVSQLLDHSNGLLKEGRVVLLCEVEVIGDGDGQIGDNTTISTEESESHCNAYPRVIDSFAHKWTIENFRYFNLDEWSIERIESDKFHSNSNKKCQFQLVLYPNGGKNEFRNNISIFLNRDPSNNVDVNVRWKISVIDENGDKFNTKRFQYTFIENQNTYRIGKYIYVPQLLDHSNGLLRENTLTLFCEVQVIGDGDGPIEDNTTISTEESESHYNAYPRVIHSLAHKWTIDNFGYFYQDEWPIETIKSDNIHSNSNKESQFYLLLYPNGERDEFRNNLSIYLHHSSSNNADSKVRWKISIINENGDKFNTKRFQYTFIENQNTYGIGKYIYVPQLLDNSNGLLRENTLTLFCEVQVIGDGDGQIEDNTTTSIEVSESHYNANPRVIDSRAHKWTIENFDYFYREEWTIDYLVSDKFQLNSNKEHQFLLLLYPNGVGEDFRNNVSIFLRHSSSNNVDVNVRLKISIIDENGNKYNTRGRQKMFCGKEYCWGFVKYISVSQLLNHSNRLLNGQLSLYCEIQILDNDIQNSILSLNESLLQSILELNQSLDSVHLSKCAHKWTIHNFACALAEDSSGEKLVSCRFSSSDFRDYRFFLLMYPKGYDEDSRNYVSLQLKFIILKKMQLTFQFRILQIDENGNKCKLYDGQLSDNGSKYFSINKFISQADIRQLLNHDALMLYCEIEVIEDWDKANLPTNKTDEYLNTLSQLKLIDNEVTETVTNAKAKKIQFEYTWEIENCVENNDTELISLFTTYPTGSCIKSPTFSLNNSTTYQHRFHLRMYPNGDDEDWKGYVSIYLGVDTFGKRQVTCQWKISLIDCFGCKFNTQKIEYRYKDIETFGSPQFISHSDLFNSANALITDNKLTVLCEIEFVNEEEIEKQNTDISIFEINKFNQSFTSTLITIPTQSITQVTLITHHWTIDNFGLYFQSIQDKDSYLESIKLSHASDDQFQFILRLYPKRKSDHISIYIDLLSNSNKKITGTDIFSVLGENDKKLFAKHYQIALPNYAYLNFNDFQIEPNSMNQFKLLFEYQHCTHYSSPTEMSHLDQFSLDHFTSPWQVKRLCDVPTHSRALTSIPVESGHFKWSIPDFSSQKDSVKSPTICLEKLEFFFQIFSQSKDKMSIYLCHKKSVEKETKVCLKISILNKDGHKTSTKDVFVKLTEVELEYECAEFEINEDDIQEDDQLKMFCEVNILKEPSCSPVFVPPIPKVLSELNPLLTNRQQSDVVLSFVNGKQLHAHRSILSARSPVFFGMFQHDTTEAQLGQVDITDVDMEVCELMLRYIYTGLVELDQERTLDLMIAADKYEIIELKIKCEGWLCTNLSVESATECLVWSDQISATKLKSKSIEFFHRNSIKISQEKTFNELLQNRPELLVELYLDSTKHLNNQIDSNVIEELEEEEEEGNISVL